MPKNILISGPTGSGKTQIARRIAKLTNAPFIRVEATKFTQNGYVGKNVDQIIKDKYVFYIKFSNDQLQTSYEDVRGDEKVKRESDLKQSILNYSKCYARLKNECLTCEVEEDQGFEGGKVQVVINHILSTRTLNWKQRSKVGYNISNSRINSTFFILDLYVKIKNG